MSSAEEAQAGLAANRQAAQDCDTLVSTDGVNRTEWKIEPGALQTIGDETLSFFGRGKIDSEIGPVDSEAFFVVARYDDIVVRFVIAWIGEASQSEMAAFLEAADSRLRR